MPKIIVPLPPAGPLLTIREGSRGASPKTWVAAAPAWATRARKAVESQLQSRASSSGPARISITARRATGQSNLNAIRDAVVHLFGEMGMSVGGAVVDAKWSGAIAPDTMMIELR